MKARRKSEKAIIMKGEKVLLARMSFGNRRGTEVGQADTDSPTHQIADIFSGQRTAPDISHATFTFMKDATSRTLQFEKCNPPTLDNP